MQDKTGNEPKHLFSVRIYFGVYKEKTLLPDYSIGMWQEYIESDGFMMEECDCTEVNGNNTIQTIYHIIFLPGFY